MTVKSGMPTFDLTPHPASAPQAPTFKLWVNVDRSGAFGRNATLNLFFCVGAPASGFVIPDPTSGSRRDELWRSTCFEAFLREEGQTTYTEWNFAPSHDWAAYAFFSPRTGMAPAEVDAPPYIRVEDNLTWWALGATIPIPADRSFDLGLSAVIEEKDGNTSYWALGHPADAPPDFHDPTCFLARLPE
jgi:hypothetical protein